MCLIYVIFSLVYILSPVGKQNMLSAELLIEHFSVLVYCNSYTSALDSICTTSACLPHLARSMALLPFCRGHDYKYTDQSASDIEK